MNRDDPSNPPRQELDFDLDALRRDVRYACLTGPGDPKDSEILDPYGFISQPPIMRRLGIWIGAWMEPEINRIVAVGASALGLALAAGLELNVPVAFVENDRILGEFSSGDRSVVVADITKTGATAKAATEALTHAGVDVEHIFVVWDRGLGALAVLADLHVPVTVLMDRRSAEAVA